ncbi:5270_t:CDS:2, partial [Acaulospora colombiana]
DKTLLRVLDSPDGPTLDETRRYPHLTELDFNWHGAKADKDKYSLHWIPEAFPNLVKLKFALCSIWDDDTLPDTATMRAHYQTLVANLPRLRKLAITENDEYDPDEEEDLVHYLGGIQPSLDQIEFVWRNLPKDTESDDPPTSAHWFKSIYIPVSDEVLAIASEKRITIDWYPDSAGKHRYNWWLGRFAPSRRREKENIKQVVVSDDIKTD